MNTKLIRVIKHPGIWLILAITPVAYYLRYFLLFIVLGFFYGPIAGYRNYFEYHTADLYTLFIFPVALGIALLGFRFRSSVKGKLLMIAGIFVWTFWGLAEIGRWC